MRSLSISRSRPSRTDALLPPSPDRLPICTCRGALEVNGWCMAACDGAKVCDERELAISGVHAAELLLFDMTQAQGATSCT